MSDDEIFCYVGSDSVCFENYDGQPVVIWDDCRHNELFKKLGDRGTIFNIFDTKPKRISQKKKYSQTNLINIINIVNSVEPIQGFLDGLAGQYFDREEGRYIDAETDQKAQSYRRFPVCINVHPQYYDIQIYQPFFGDGSDIITLKCHHAPFKDMIKEFGNDSAEYKEHCLQALKPVVDLFERAQKILAQRTTVYDDGTEKFEGLGTSMPYREYIDNHQEKLRDYINDVFKYKFDGDTDKVVTNYCSDNDITDSALIDIIRCEIEDYCRNKKYN